MLRDVEAFALLVFGDPEPDGDIDELQQDEADDGVIDDGDGDAIELGQDLAGIAVDPAHRRLGAGHGLGGEDAGQHRPDDAADGMDAEGIEGVVIAERVLQGGGGEEAEHPGDDADDQRPRRIDEARGGGHRHQPRDRAGDDAEHAGLLLGHPFREHPGQRGGGRGDLGRRHGHAGADVGGHRRARIEAEPAHPEQRGADQAEADIVGVEGRLAIADPGAEHEAGDQPGDAGVDMHHRAAGIVEHAHARPGTRRPRPYGRWAHSRRSARARRRP